jgi:hypothetical protein
MVEKIVSLVAAMSPSRKEMLKLLERLRAEIESGETIEIVVVTIHPNLEFSTLSTGELRCVELSGYLLRAALDASDRVKSK